jgi:hypothetical protein
MILKCTLFRVDDDVFYCKICNIFLKGWIKIELFEKPRVPRVFFMFGYTHESRFVRIFQFTLAIARLEKNCSMKDTKGVGLR